MHEYKEDVCTNVFLALMTALVLCARSQDFAMSVGYTLFSRSLDLRAEESRVVRLRKLPRCREASRKPCALSRVLAQAIGALASGTYSLNYPSTPVKRIFNPYSSAYQKENQE